MVFNLNKNEIELPPFNRTLSSDNINDYLTINLTMLCFKNLNVIGHGLNR